MDTILRKHARVRLKWNVLAYGGFGKTSKELRPGSSLFESTFSKTNKQRASVVVVCAGSNDAKRGLSGDDTMSNLEEICENLSRRGLLVYVVDLPNTRGGKHINLSKLPNKLLREYLNRVGNKAMDKDEQLTIFPSVKLSLFQLKSLFNDYTGGLTSKGHKQFATRLMDDLLPGIARVEFRKWSRMLVGSRSKKK